MAHANVATRASTSATAKKTLRSSGEAPESRLRMSRTAKMLPRRPSTNEADPRRLEAVQKDTAQDCASLRAECDADADLPGALGDQVGEYAVESDGSERERHDGERKDEERGKAGVEGGLADGLLHGEDVGDGQVGIYLGEDLLDGQGESDGIESGLGNDGDRRGPPVP
jgi:hypothetical protein